MATKVIVKVQVPLMSTDANPGFLVYDEHQAYVRCQAVRIQTVNALKQDLKGYFEAEWNAQYDRWVIGKRVGDQPW